ncbi:hypothetical protein BH23GEM5_BH23GEM5_05580 [soil metagenome]
MNGDLEIGALTGLEGEYEIIGELGRGGISVVYLARERLLGREVAIKVIRDQYLRDAEAVARMEREAQTLARIHHPNIVTLYGAKQLPDGGLALVMQHLCGGTLRDTIRKDGPFSPARTERVLREVASALVYLHDQGVIHRDIKPENIFVEGGDGRAVLSDFGLAKGMDGLANVTLTGSVIGTPTYMSPEQVDGSELDGRSDLYSLGLVGHELLTGMKPWAGEGLYSVIFKQKHEALPSLEEVCPGVPESLKDVIEGLLEKNRELRWATARELLAQLGSDAIPKEPPALKLFTAPPGPKPGRIPALEGTPTIALPMDALKASPVPIHRLPKRFAPPVPSRLAAAAVVVLALGGGGLLFRGHSPAAAAAEPAAPILQREVVSPSARVIPASLNAGGAAPPAPQVIAAAPPRELARPLEGRAPPLPTLPTPAAAPLPEADTQDMAAAATILGAVTPREVPALARGNQGGRSVPAPLSTSRIPAAAEVAAPTLTALPRLRNPEGVRSRMERRFAPDLRSKGLSGSVGLEIGIDETGRVISARVEASSGYDELDAAAVKLTDAMRFAPAEASGKAVPASVRVPITLAGSDDPSAISPPAAGSSNSGPRASASPKLLNSDEVQHALGAAYPAALKRAGTGGTVHLRLDLDEKGHVMEITVARTSGHQELDAAALQIARTMRFSPQREQGRPVSARVEVPVTFQRSPRS